MRVLGATSSSVVLPDVEFLGATFQSSGLITETSFLYPTASADGDLIVAWAVCENNTAITIPTGWTSLYAANGYLAENGALGATSGRLLIYKVRGPETSTAISLPGGGNVTCFAFPSEYTPSHVLEYGVGEFTADVEIVGKGATFVAVNKDGTYDNELISFTEPTINSRYTWYTDAVTTGDTRSMAYAGVAAPYNEGYSYTSTIAPLTEAGAFAMVFSVS